MDIETKVNDQHRLDDVTIKQMTWKPSIARNIAVRIVQLVINAGTVWPDEVDTSDVLSDDKNVIGTVWRNLARHGIIRHGTSFRRSVRKSSGSRTIFMYELASQRLAETFLRRNGITNIYGKQRELFPAAQ